MENASKALIIAGAILISILIIAIGMYIYNSSQGAITGAAQDISATEIQAFNRMWEMYDGTQTGTNVKDLISKLIANAKANSEVPDRLPTLHFSGDAKTISELNAKKNSVVSRKNYTVTTEASETTGLIDSITVTDL